MQPKNPLFSSSSQHPLRFGHAVYLGSDTLMPLQGVSYVANEEGPCDFMFYCSLRRSIVYILREKS